MKTFNSRIIAKPLYVFLLSFLFAVAASITTHAIQPGVFKESLNRKSVFHLHYENARVDIQFLNGGIVVVELFAPEIYSSFPSYLTVKDGPPPVWFDSRPEMEMISLDGVHVKYGSKDFELSITVNDKTLLSIPAGGIEWNPDGSYTIKFAKEPEDHFIGLGMEAPDVLGNVSAYDHDKKKLELFNRHVAPSHMIIPFFFNPNGYGLFIDNPWTAELNFKPKSTYSYTAKGGPLRFYFIEGQDSFKVLNSYTALTGRAPVPPRWATGYMQCRYGYENESDFRGLMDNFRHRKLPADTLIMDLDWFGRDTMGNLWWTDRNFPDGPGFQKEIHARGFHTINIVEPYVFMKSYNFDELWKRGMFTRKPDGSMYEFPFWGEMPAGLMDFSNPETREWFGDKVARIKESGVDAWWTDLDEPEKDFEDTHYLIGNRDSAHNLQGFLMNKAISDMYDVKFPDDRVMIMSRSGFAGIQRFGSGVWSGDVNASFQHLANQIPIGIAASMSGIAMFNSDTGGFHGEPSPELYVRWFQFSAFNPIFRSHGNHSIREPWSFGEEAERICGRYLELRYMMVPYLYTLFREMNETGAPVMRPMFMEFPGDPDSLIRNEQFMYGPSILVAPVVEEGADSKKVYLPPGEWTYLWDERRISGPRGVKIPVDLETMPIFVREGAILPMAPAMQYTEEMPVDPLTIHYFPSETPSEFALYEDDGLSRAYQRGEYSETRITAKYEPGKVMEVTINAPAGSYAGMPESRSCEVVLHHSTPPGKVVINGNKMSDDNWNYDSDDMILTVPVTSCSGGARVEAVYN